MEKNDVATTSEMDGDGIIAKQNQTVKSMENEIENLKKKYEEAAETLKQKQNQIKTLEENQRKSDEELKGKGNEIQNWRKKYEEAFENGKKSMESEIENLKKKFKEATENMIGKENKLEEDYLKNVAENQQKFDKELQGKLLEFAKWKKLYEDSSRDLESIKTRFLGPIDTKVQLFSKAEEENWNRCCQYISDKLRFKQDLRTRSKIIRRKLTSIENIQKEAKLRYKLCKWGRNSIIKI